MRAVLIRHGKTPGNAQHRYIGRTDESLGEEGRREAERSGRSEKTEVVYVSPLVRARETAAILFPRAGQRILPGLRETDFGDFEGKNAEEMAEDPAYLEWLQGMCLGRCPGGESRAEVQRRAVGAFAAALRDAEREGRECAVFVTHGGVIMGLLEALAVPHRDYYDYGTPNLYAWEAECRTENGSVLLRLQSQTPSPVGQLFR